MTVQLAPALPVYAAQFFCIRSCPVSGSSYADTGRAPELKERIRASARAEAKIVVVSLIFKIVSPSCDFSLGDTFSHETFEMQAAVATQKALWDNPPGGAMAGALVFH